MKKNKKIYQDMIINILASALPIVIMQLGILPAVARIAPVDYGILITWLSVFNIASSMLGNALNNIRLLREQIYIQKKEVGDFNIIFIITNTGVAIFIASYQILILNKYDFIELLLLVLLSLLFSAREYYIVAFRLILNYKNILYCNICQVFGYCLGFILFYIFGRWELIYICGYTISIFFIFIKSNLWLEAFAITNLFKDTIKEYFYLMFGNFLSRFTDYADRIILFPILGGEAVSIYYVAVSAAKIISLLLNPINNVILTYLSKWENLNEKTFISVLLGSSVIALVGYFICILLSEPILKIIYPQYVSKAMKYIYITSAFISISIVVSVISPFILRFFNIKWQLYLNVISVIFYLLVCFLLLKEYNLYGFCLGVLFTMILKLVLFLFICYINRKMLIKN